MNSCYILLKSSQQSLQLCFKPQLNRRFIKKSYEPSKSRVFSILGLSTWESRDKMTFGCKSHDQYIKNTIRGKWWLPPNLGRIESCEFMYAYGSFVHQKCSNYALINLLFSLCIFVWIIDPLVTHPNPHLGTLTRPFTPEVLWVENHTLTSSSFVISNFLFVFKSFKECGGVSCTNQTTNWLVHS